MFKFYTFLFCFLFFAKASADSNCELFTKSQNIQEIFNLISLSKSSGVAPLGFKVHTQKLVFFDQKNYPLCFVLYHQDKLHTFPLKKIAEIENGIYNFRDKDNLLSPTDEKQVSLPLRKLGIEKFLIYNFDSNGIDSFSGEESTTRYHFSFIIHEGYHLLKQRGVVLNNWDFDQPYFDWSYSQGREFVSSNCYTFNEKVQRSFQSEQKALVEGYRSIVIGGNKNGAFASLKKFIKIRSDRYNTLAPVKLTHPSWKSAGNCQGAEAYLEHLEGGAEYVEISYLLKLGLIKPADIISSHYLSHYSTKSAYYVTGMLQLLLAPYLISDFGALERAMMKPNENQDQLPYKLLLRYFNDLI